MWTNRLSCRCCIAGGGLAGMMLGLLLARAGVDMIVLEQHGNFLRDFRGDTVHPSTLQVICELGSLNQFLARPHDEARTWQLMIGNDKFQVADFSPVRTRCKFIAMTPQWEVLDFLRNTSSASANVLVLIPANICFCWTRRTDCRCRWKRRGEQTC